MKISIPKIFTGSNKNIKPRQLCEHGVTSDMKPVSDSFLVNVEKALNFDSNGDLSVINYYPDVALSGAIMDILRDGILLEELSKIKINPKQELKKLEQEILKSKDIREVKVKSLIGYGYRALVFETEDGKVIKITHGDHFNGRKPADFDLPIIQSGKLTDDGEFYYYIEEKISHDNLTQSELSDFIKKIKKSGYRLTDYRVDGLPFGEISAEQFGRLQNGKIYLIDPESAVKIDPNESIFTKIYNFFFNK